MKWHMKWPKDLGYMMSGDRSEIYSSRSNYFRIGEEFTLCFGIFRVTDRVRLPEGRTYAFGFERVRDMRKGEVKSLIAAYKRKGAK